MMRRRTFLQIAGLNSVAATVGYGMENEGPITARIDQGLLTARNRNRSTVVCQNGIVCASQPPSGSSRHRRAESGRQLR
jgi:hypothetical protein